MNLFTAKWPFYVSGVLFAGLIVLSLYLFNGPLGLGEAMTVVGEYAEEAALDQRLSRPPKLDWQLGLLIGIFLGALTAALSSGKYKPEFASPGDGTFTVKAVRSVVGGMAGGFLVMLGIQLAGDSVLGQFAAAVQLSGGAWIFLLSMTVSGCLLAVLLERRGEGGGKLSGRTAGKEKN